MAWSTRELADLAGVSIKTVRHYHAVGVLAEPDRAANGYKQYRTGHLVRLLQVRRLHDLGVPLAEIATYGPGDGPVSTTLESLDRELEAEIRRLTRVRAELAHAMDHTEALDLPAELGPIAHRLADADRSMIMVMSRVFSSEAMADVYELAAARTPTDDEFDAIAADADDDVIQDLAERMAPSAQRFREEHGWVENPVRHHPPRHSALAASALVDALAEIYNPAQREVIRRMNVINGHPS